MLKRAGTAFVAFIIAVGFWIGTAQDAQAQVRVTVMGQDYDITATQGSFTQVQGITMNALTNTTTAPWFTNNTADRALSQAFRDAWVAVNDASAIPTNTELLFAYALSSGNVLGSSAINNGGTIVSNGTGAPAVASVTSAFTLYYATATLVEVPEINGSALAQMFLVLLVGYLMVMARRRVG